MASHEEDAPTLTDNLVPATEERKTDRDNRTRQQQMTLKKTKKTQMKTNEKKRTRTKRKKWNMTREVR